MHNRRLTTILILLACTLLGSVGVAAQTDDEGIASPPMAASPMHPVFPLLDAAGENVLDSGRAVSTMTTCGGCHDTAFIAANSDHADVGLATFSAPGAAGSLHRAPERKVHDRPREQRVREEGRPEAARAVVEVAPHEASTESRDDDSESVSGSSTMPPPTKPTCCVLSPSGFTCARS